MADIAPDAIALQSFRTVLRGYDPSEVRGFLRGLSDGIQALIEERDRLQAKLGLGDPDDLRREIEQVSKEIEAVLEAGRSASEAMRERAAAEAARWRSEAIAEAEKARRAAEADAEHLRSDAWTTAEALLTETQREISEMRTQAEKESMRLVGEAEREAHRMVGAGRREAEDAVRSARMQADKLALDAQQSHDEIIETARREAEVAQERTRALEERRDELRRELDSVRSALASVETELDERREALGLTPAPPSDDEGDDENPADASTWAPGETVRVVRPGQPQARGEGAPVSSDPRVAPEPTPELRVLSPQEARSLQRSDPPPVVQEEDDDVLAPVDEPVYDPTPDTEADDGPVPDDDEPGSFTAATEVEEVEAPTTDEHPVIDSPTTIRMVDAPTADAEAPVEADDADEPDTAASGEDEVASGGQLSDVDGLFARLRQPARPSDDAPASAGPATLTRLAPGVDPFEVRERLLLPISNRALRNLKRQLTELQNIALEEIRLDPDDWMPDLDAVRVGIRADLVVLAAEGFAAGHTGAETLVADRLTRPPTPKVDLATDFAASMCEDVEKALDDGRARDHGARQLGADISRVFRAWRTDESERRIRDLSVEAYNRGVAETLRGAGLGELRWSVSGRGCARCRERSAADTVEDVTIVHDGCGCTVVPA